VVKAARPDEMAKRTISKTGMCIVPQGAKRVTLGQDVYYRPGQGNPDIGQSQALYCTRRKQRQCLDHNDRTDTSQFSREYSRFFGSSPAKDIARLREYPIT
jgi:hypothetical protein